MKSVKSFNPCESVILTIYDIIKAHGDKLKVKTEVGEGSLALPGIASAETGSEFIIQLPIV